MTETVSVTDLTNLRESLVLGTCVLSKKRGLWTLSVGRTKETTVPVRVGHEPVRPSWVLKYRTPRREIVNTCPQPPIYEVEGVRNIPGETLQKLCQKISWRFPYLG